MDLVTIERGNKGLMEGFEGVMRNLIPACSMSLTILAYSAAARTSRSMCSSACVPSTHLLACCSKKKAVLLGEKRAKGHRSPSRVCPHAAGHESQCHHSYCTWKRGCKLPPSIRVADRRSAALERVQSPVGRAVVVHTWRW